MNIETFLFNKQNQALAIMMAGSLTVSACSGSNASHKTTNTLTSISPSTEQLAQPPISADTVKSCIDPTESDIKQTQKLLAAPINPVFDVLSAQSQKLTSDAYQALVQQTIQQKAREENLTIFDGQPILSTMEGPLLSKSPNILVPSFYYFFNKARNFIQQYGIDLVIGTPDMQFYKDGRAPIADDLEAQGPKILMSHIVQAFSNKPLELVLLAGLKRIVLVTGLESDDVAGYVVISNQPETIYLDVPKSGDQQVSVQDIDHEFYHILDSAQCGSEAMLFDSGFSVLNNGEDIYTGQVKDQTTPNLETYLSTLSADSTQEHIARIDHKQSLLCTIVQKRRNLASQVITYSAYHPNPAEDKAVLGSKMFERHSFGLVDDPIFKLLYPKFRYLLARLFHQEPNVAEYLTSVGDRPIILPDEATC